MFVPPEISYFNFLGFPIYYYGIILAFAIFVGIVIANKYALEEYGLFNFVPQVAASTILGGILGARLYYCLLNYDFYLRNPFEILALREGGLSIHGAIIGGLIVLYIHSRQKDIPFLKICDIFALGMPIAQAIGRWGNFFNSEAFGLPTALPWGMFVRQPFRPDRYFSDEFFHPTFLYESVLDILIFFILIKIILPKYKQNHGCIAAFYLLLYSVVRLFIEAIRVDCVRYCFGMPFPQVVSIVIIVLMLFFIVKNTDKDRRV